MSSGLGVAGDEAMVTVSVIQVRRTPSRASWSSTPSCSGVGRAKTRAVRSPAIRVRACDSSMRRKERLKPRTPVSDPTPTATASTTKTKRAREARISRQAMRQATRQGSCLIG